jgi:nicotinamidase-related amidase
VFVVTATATPATKYTMQPRTIGFEVTKKFQCSLTRHRPDQVGENSGLAWRSTRIPERDRVSSRVNTIRLTRELDMIRRFGDDTALLIIDAQVGVNALEHWGGPGAERNNPDAEMRIGELLHAWRDARRAVFYTAHDSREPHSPLKLSLPTGAFLPGLEPRRGETVIRKDVNGGFIGTDLEIRLRRAGITRLVTVGFFTNMCVETTVRQGGNMGYDIYLAEDACATTNRIGYDGRNHDSGLVHALSVASMHREFCTALPTAIALQLLAGNAAHLERAAGNHSAEELL